MCLTSTGDSLSCNSTTISPFLEIFKRAGEVTRLALDLLAKSRYPQGHRGGTRPASLRVAEDGLSPGDVWIAQSIHRPVGNATSAVDCTIHGAPTMWSRLSRSPSLEAKRRLQKRPAKPAAAPCAYQPIHSGRMDASRVHHARGVRTGRPRGRGGALESAGPFYGPARVAMGGRALPFPFSEERLAATAYRLATRRRARPPRPS